MSETCVFCNYKGPSPVLEYIHNCRIFEPLNPVTPGHVIVVPEQHVADAAQDPYITGEAMRAAAFWLKRTGGDANIITSIGPAATQTVKHLHVHVVPRHENDGLKLPWDEG